MPEDCLSEKINKGNEIYSDSWKEDFPTIFELNAHDNFHSLIQPAISHVIKVLLPGEVRRLGWVEGGSDEMACVLHMALEAVFMRFNDTSFAEFFYEFKRAKVSSATSSKSKFQALASFLYLVFLPYARLKIEKKYLEEQNDRNLSKAEWSWSYFVSLYPEFNAIYESLSLISQVAYTLGRFKHYNPLLYTMGMVVGRNIPGDGGGVVADKLNNSYSVKPWQLNFKSLMINTGLILVGCFQFVEWWQREDRPPLNLFPTHIPPYPHTHEATNELVFILCPLCRQHRRNDTVLATSGYVFCNKCISDYVRVHCRCPVTGHPTHPGTLVRLFADQAT